MTNKMFLEICKQASSACKNGEKVLYVDVEGTFNMKAALKAGFSEDFDNFFVLRAVSGEEILDFLQATDADFIIVDSLLAVTPSITAKTTCAALRKKIMEILVNKVKTWVVT